MATRNLSELYSACRDGNITAVNYLLPRTVLSDVNRLESNGSSCLHAASCYGHIEIVRRLLEFGLSRQLKDKNGQTPLDQAGTKEIAELFSRPTETAQQRFAPNSSENPQWLFGKAKAEAFSRAIERGCVKDRGIKKTVNKIEDANIIPIDGSKQSQLLRFYLNEAREKNDPTFLLKMYTVDGLFFKELNLYMATGTPKKVYKRLCGKWSGYYTGVIMKNPALDPYRFSGMTYRGMEVTRTDLEQYKIGDALTNKAFQSTSKSRTIALKFAIRSPPTLGTSPVLINYLILDRRSALDIRSLSEFPAEEEVLMVPGCLFKVDDIKKNGNLIEIHLRQLLWTDE